jgi:hypothetical protein
MPLREAGETLEHTSITSNLLSARSNARWRWGSGSLSKSRERLEECYGEARAARHAPGIAQRAVEGEEVALEDFDAFEAGRAMAASFTPKLPLIHTVAAGVTGASRSGALSILTGRGALHRR